MRIRTELIEWYIRKNNLQKREFCKQCNMSEKTLRKIMKNDYKYQTATIFRIAETINIDICDLYITN